MERDGELDQPGKTPSGRRLRRALAAIVVSVLLLVVLVGVAGTGPVLRLALPLINQSLSDALDAQVEIRDVRGSLWSRLEIGRFVLDEPRSGLAVDLEALALDWSPQALLGGVVQVNAIAAHKLSFTLPAPAGEETPPSESAFAVEDLLSPPVTIRVAEAELTELAVLEPTSGRSFLYRLAARASASAQHPFDLHLSLEPLDESVDRLRAALVYEAASGQLDADVEANLDRRGLVMALAGLPPEQAQDIALKLAGEGPLAAWRGGLSIGASETGHLVGNVGLALQQKSLHYNFQGQAQLSDALFPDLPREIRQEIALSLDGEVPFDLGRLDLTSLDVRKEKWFSARAEAGIDLEENTLSATLQSKLAPAMAGLLGGSASWQDLTLNARAEGAIASPRLELDVTALEIATPEVSSPGVSLFASAEPKDEEVVWRADLVSSAPRWRTPALGALFPDRLEVLLEGAVSRDGKSLTLSRLAVPGLALAARGEAELGAGGRVAEAEMTADLADLSVFSAVSGLSLQGAGQVVLSSGRWTPESGGEARLGISASALSLGQSDLTRVVGAAPEIDADLSLSPGGELSVALPRIALAQAGGKGSLRFTEAFGRVSGTLDATAKPGIAPPGSALSLGEPVTLSGRFDGPINRPQAMVQLRSPVLRAGGEVIDQAVLDLALSWQGENIPQLQNDASFRWRGRPYEASARATFHSDRLGLETIALRGEGLSLAGDLALPGYAIPLEGQVRLNELGASGLAALGVPLERGALQAVADFLPEDGEQGVRLQASAQGLAFSVGEGGKGQFERLDLSGRVGQAFSDPVFDLKLQGSGGAAGSVAIARLSAQLEGAPTDAEVHLALAGNYGEDLPLGLDGRGSFAQGETTRLTVTDLSATIGPQTLALREPLSLTQARDGRLTVRAALGSNSGGTLDATLEMLPEKSLSAELAVRRIELDPWMRVFQQIPLKGVATVDLRFEEKQGEQPRASMAVAVDDLGSPDIADLPSFRLQMDGTLTGGVMEAALKLDQADVSVLRARSNLRASLSALDGLMALPADTSLSAELSLNAEIADFWPYVPLPEHALSGEVRVEATASGTMVQPSLSGTVSLQEGRYENYAYGTLLQDIAFNGTLSPEGLVIPDLSARDGGEGQLSGAFELSLGPDWATAFEARVAAQNTAVARLDELRAWVDADLRIVGDNKALSVSGVTKLRRGEVDLAVALPPSVSELDVEFPDGKDETQAPDAKSRPPLATSLDVTVDIPGRLFVRGKSLDSEWGGQLRITGQADAPKVVGRLTALRGQLDVIGKVFTVKDSSIVFTGAYPVDPLLDITGVHKADGLTVRASLSGPSSAPELSLTSDPSLPQDEILSRVLFGKSQGNLTSFEAIQLASAAAELSGGGGGLDVVGSIRRFVGVDVLRVESGDDGPAVKAGQYLSEDIYVGAKQGTTPGSGGVEVEIELTPQLKATSETSGGDTKAGLQWKLDY